MHETAEYQHLSLTQAARIAPGDVSPNCLWRWCRRGVLSRSGGRIKLQHVRIGGKLFTTARWIEEFGKRLAEADADYFDRIEDAAAAPQPQASRRRLRRSLDPPLAHVAVVVHIDLNWRATQRPL